MKCVVAAVVKYFSFGFKYSSDDVCVTHLSRPQAQPPSAQYKRIKLSTIWYRLSQARGESFHISTKIQEDLLMEVIKPSVQPSCSLANPPHTSYDRRIGVEYWEVEMDSLRMAPLST